MLVICGCHVHQVCVCPTMCVVVNEGRWYVYAQCFCCNVYVEHEHGKLIWPRSWSKITVCVQIQAILVATEEVSVVRMIPGEHHER